MNLIIQMCIIKQQEMYVLMNLRPDECSQEFHFYPFAVKLDRCVGSCNTRKELSNK